MKPLLDPSRSEDYRRNARNYRTGAKYRLMLPRRNDGTPYDVASLARGVLVRNHALYPALLRAEARLQATMRTGLLSYRLRLAAKHHGIGRRMHPCLTPSVNRGRDERAAVDRLTKAVIADAFRLRPWPAYGDMRAFVYWLTQADVNSRLDYRRPSGDPRLHERGERLLEWAHTAALAYPTYVAADARARASA